MRLCIVLLLAMLYQAIAVYAEQPNAEKYRSYFAVEQFYVEYADDKQNYVVAGSGEKRMATIASQFYSDELDYYNGKKDYPNVLYLEGKYYQFLDRHTATVALDYHLNSHEVDVRGRWNTLKNRLCIPDEFAPLVLKDRFRSDSFNYVMPILVESGKVGTYEFDKYCLQLHSHTGRVLSETVYNYYYDKGNLCRIDSLFVRNGKSSKLGSIKVKQITDVIPEKTFKIPKGCKVYAIGLGDMNDLLDQREIVERY